MSDVRPGTAADRARWRRYLADERAEAAVYRELAARRDGEEREILLALAAAEGRHEAHWLALLGGDDSGVPRADIRTRMLGALARRFGSIFVLALAQRAEARSPYATDPDATAAMAADERIHGEVVRGLAARGRRRLAGTFRAAVFGANDGLVSNLALVMGVAGADLPGRTILITGFAGLLAGSFSMALGEWLSVQSSRELYENQMRTEAAEIEASPEEEAEELALIYEARGIEKGESEILARRILADPAKALDVMAREELGIDPSDLGGSPWVAAGASFLLFSAGALIPVLPFLFTSGGTAVLASIAVSTLGLFALGAGITLFTARPAFRSGMRSVLFGLVAAAGTWLIGRLIGVTVAG
jgi:vacuolar iron transporter family protein